MSSLYDYEPVDNIEDMIKHMNVITVAGIVALVLGFGIAIALVIIKYT